MLMLYITTTTLVAQGIWAKAFGQRDTVPTMEMGWTIIQTTDGGYAVAGSAQIGGSFYDALLLRLTPNGDLIWAKAFGGPSHDQPGLRMVAQTTDGGFILAGSTVSFGAGGYDCFILKLTSDGSLSWAKTFGGLGNDWARAVIQSTDGGYLVVGYTESLDLGILGASDCLVLKLASDGSLIWAKTFGWAAWDEAFSITQTTDGGYAIAGYTYDASFNKDFLVFKLTSDGSVSWANQYGNTSRAEEAWSIIQTTDGGYAVAGYTEAGANDFLVLKLASDGSLSWKKRIGGSNDENSPEIIQTADGGYAVVGRTWSFGAGNYDFLIFKLATDGSLSWAKTMGGSNYDEPFSIIQTTDGGYAVAGRTNSPVNGYEVLVLKLPSDGNYPGCIADCSPTVVNPGLNTTSLSIGADCSPISGGPLPDTTTPLIAITNVCEPLYEDVEEGGLESNRPIICFSVPGGLIFRSEAEADVKLYTPDGRLACSRKLIKGENRISLDEGVYLWTTHNLEPVAPNQKGKAIVR